MNEEILEGYSTILDIVEKTPIFGALSKEEIKEVLSYMTLKKYKKGDIIFKKGSSPENIYIIENGVVKSSTEINNEIKNLKTYTTGDCFGEVALLGIMPYALDCIAMSDLSLLQISRASFHQLSKINPKLFTKLLLNITREVCRHNYYLYEILIENFKKTEV